MKEMMKKLFYVIGIHISLLFSLLFLWENVNAQTAVVNALFFYSPTCPHCHEVMEKDFPIFRKMFGDQLNIIEINTYEQAGSELYMKAVEVYNIPENRQGVPTMIIGDTVMVGSYEIPNMLPQVVEDGLSKGGIDVPDLPGLAEYLGKEGKGSKQEASFVDIFQRDILGNSISVIVLLGLVASLVINLRRYLSLSKNQKKTDINQELKFQWVIPIIALIGLGIAFYLAFVELTNTEAICGPVGDCNAVQQSPYARLFGIIPVGIIGVIGFLAIIIVWGLGQIQSFVYRNEFKKILWGMTLLGVLFASYLTFLEPFVIGATCAWCLSVAICMLILLFLTTPQAAVVSVQVNAEKTKKRHR